MGFDGRDIVWPKKRKPPKQPKQKGGSGKQSGTIAGMAILMVALPAAVMALVVAYLIVGHLGGQPANPAGGGGGAAPAAVHPSPIEPPDPDRYRIPDPGSRPTPNVVIR